MPLAACPLYSSLYNRIKPSRSCYVIWPQNKVNFFRVEMNFLVKGSGLIASLCHFNFIVIWSYSSILASDFAKILHFWLQPSFYVITCHVIVTVMRFRLKQYTLGRRLYFRTTGLNVRLWNISEMNKIYHFLFFMSIRDFSVDGQIRPPPTDMYLMKPLKDGIDGTLSWFTPEFERDGYSDNLAALIWHHG